MGEFLMPSLGADMERGTVVRWLVKPGDRVTRGEIVVEIETEKAEMEVEIFEDGVIDSILVPEGETVAVGTPLARLTPAPGERPAAVRATEIPGRAAQAPEKKERQPMVGGSETAPTSVRPRPKEPAHPPAEPAAAHATPTARVLAQRLGVDLGRTAGTGVGGTITRADVERAAHPPASATGPTRVRSSPFARRLAAAEGIDLSGMGGSGPGGAITATDVTNALTAAPPRPPEPTPAAVPPVEHGPGPRAATRQRAVGALMERSKREIPHYYLATTIDLEPALAWLREENARRPVGERILPAALLLRAVVAAALEHPQVNGHYLDGEFRPASGVDLGVAIALRDGSLLTPAILRADAMTLSDLMGALRGLVGRARAGKLRASEMVTGSITVTSLGDVGVEFVQGVIYPPQVAMVGFGTPVERPWARNGMVGARTVVTATLSADHRVTNGHQGSLFLAAVGRHLEMPETL